MRLFVRQFLTKLWCALFVCSLLPSLVSGQSEHTYQWRFGNGAGVDFNSGLPASIGSAHPMNALHSTASMSDEQGNLLFYSNGTDVWDASNTPMPNGASAILLQNSSYISVQDPGNTDRYYMVGVGSDGSDLGIYYSVVDMTLNGGLGDVLGTAKDQLLHDLNATGDRLFTAVNHANGKDIWFFYGVTTTSVVTADTLFVRLLTANGFNAPVAYTLANNVVFRPQEQLKIAPDGSYLTIQVQNPVAFNTAVLPFDNQNGTFGLPFFLERGGTAQAFSCDGRFLYIAAQTNAVSDVLVQYDLSSNDPLTIQQTETVLDSTFGMPEYSLQLAPNGRIYRSTQSTNVLDAILNPTAFGTGANFQTNNVNLAVGNSEFGFPAYNQSCLLCGIIDSGNCANDTVWLSLRNELGVDSVVWNFGDIASGTANTATGFNPFHKFSGLGGYNIQAQVHRFGSVEIVQTTVSITNAILPVVDLGNDSSVCDGVTIELDATNQGATYLWSTGSISPTVIANSTDTYVVSVTNDCGTAIDSVYLEFELPLFMVWEPVQSACEGDSLWLTPATGGPADFIWSNGATTDSILIGSSGEYVVTASNKCNAVSGAFNITISPLPEMEILQEDTVRCEGDSILLEARVVANNFQWNTGATDTTILVRESGIYTVTGENDCGLRSDNAQVEFQLPPALELGETQVICPGETVTLEVRTTATDLVWENGLTETTREVNAPGQFFVEVTDDLGCTNNDSVAVINCPSIWIPNAFTPNANDRNEIFKPIGQSLDDYRFFIYNRWGERIFSTSDLNMGWDGVQNGQLAPPGVYTWRIEFISIDGHQKVRIGQLQLIR